MLWENTLTEKKNGYFMAMTCIILFKFNGESNAHLVRSSFKMC